MTLDSVIKHIDKNGILASRDGIMKMRQSKSWSDLVDRFSTLNIHDMRSIGEIIIDKLAGASDEVIEKFKLEIHDLKVYANNTHRKHLDSIRKLHIKTEKLEKRIRDKNKQLASLRYKLNKKDIDTLKNRAQLKNNTIINIGSYKLIKESK